MTWRYERTPRKTRRNLTGKGFPHLFLSATRTRHLCLLAANEGISTHDFLRLIGDVPPDRHAGGRGAAVTRLERDGLLARFVGPGSRRSVYLDPDFPAYEELRSLLVAIGRSNGIRIGKPSTAWTTLRGRRTPGPDRPLLTAFGSEARTLALVLPYLMPGITQGYLADQCGVGTNWWSLLYPLVRDGLLVAHRQQHYVFYGLNPDFEWIRQLRALLAQMVILEPDFKARAKAIASQKRLRRARSVADRIAEDVFGAPD